MASLVSSTCWVRRGVAKQVPDKLQIDPEDLKDLITDLKDDIGWDLRMTQSLSDWLWVNSLLRVSEKSELNLNLKWLEFDEWVIVNWIWIDSHSRDCQCPVSNWVWLTNLD